MQLEWTRPALNDLKSARNYIAADNPGAAEKTAERILEAVEYLLEYPNMGRLGRVLDTRELIISGTPFVIVYRVIVPRIQILRVLHHARKWPR